MAKTTIRTRGTLQQYLESRSIPEPNSGCWLWLRSTRVGYGQFHWGGKLMHAHRASYGAFKGPIPAGKHVLHKCDMPLCINPDHLFLGTNYDNIQDALKKGRNAKGEKHGRRKISLETANEIKKSKEPLLVAAAKYGVSRSQIWNIRTGRQWAE